MRDMFLFYHAAWSEDDSRIVTASTNGTARIYFVVTDGPDSLIELTCQHVSRNMTLGEWRSYIGKDTPYRQTCPDPPSP